MVAAAARGCDPVHGDRVAGRGRTLVRVPALRRPDRAGPGRRVAVGIDAGLDSLLTLSTGEKITNPRHERRDRAALARAQRDLARKAKESANRAKARLKVARVHARITDRRRDHLHKLTTRLVRENQTIVIEDLTVRNMVKNRSLARAISDAAWRQFRTMLEYKADWYGRNLIVVDRWFPSSKLCSACGALAERMPLNVRTWTCRCGTIHDRDVNAARNILAAGLAVTACGAGVRPQRESSRTGQSAVKQETPRATPGIPRPLGRGGCQQSPQRRRRTRRRSQRHRDRPRRRCRPHLPLPPPRPARPVHAIASPATADTTATPSRASLQADLLPPTSAPSGSPASANSKTPLPTPRRADLAGVRPRRPRRHRRAQTTHTHLEQQAVDLRIQLDERDQDLTAARAANRELMTQLNAARPTR